MRIFHLRRLEDESGISGTGKVAEGVEFDSGFCVLNWLTQTDEKTNLSSIGVYPNIQAIERIHGHNGKTEILIDVTL